MRLQTRSFQTAVMRELGAELKLPKQTNPYPRANVAPLEVYSRPSAQFVYQLSQGDTVDEAEAAAAERLGQLATADVVLADRDETHSLYAETPAIVGYRRVIHPELSRSGTCGLCIVASDRFYTRGDLMPLHDRCNCIPMPIVKGDDPGKRLNSDDLGRIYAAAGGNFAEQLKFVRVNVDEHGELGPVLVKKGDHFRTPAEAGRPEYVKPTAESKRRQTRDALDSASKQLDDVQRELADLQKQIPSSLDYDRLDPGMQKLVDRRATLTQLTKNLRDYVAMLQATERSL
jgi:hypothetical protein